MVKFKRTGYDYIPVAGEDYSPSGNPPKGEEVRILREDGANVVVVGEDGIERTVPKSWIQ